MLAGTPEPGSPAALASGADRHSPHDDAATRKTSDHEVTSTRGLEPVARAEHVVAWVGGMRDHERSPDAVDREGQVSHDERAGALASEVQRDGRGRRGRGPRP